MKVTEKEIDEMKKQLLAAIRVNEMLQMEQEGGSDLTINNVRDWEIEFDSQTQQVILGCKYDTKYNRIVETKDNFMSLHGKFQKD